MTLPLLLAAAVEHAAQPGIAEKFGLEPKYIIMQVISFLIVLGVLYKFGIKPVTATMEERNRKIEAGIQHAEEMQVKLTAAQQESAAIVKQAIVEASRIVDDARKLAKDYLDKHTQEATANAESGTTAFNLVGLLSGDVNGSWSAPPGSVDLDTLQPNYFDAMQNIFGTPLSQWGII